MKTIREWLELLPEPYKGQALENADSPDTLYLVTGDVAEAISAAFVWEHTPEGYAYWAELNDKIYYKELVFPIVPTMSPTNALSALHAIAAKEGFPVEEIMSVTKKYGHVWGYWLKDVPHEMIVNLSNDK